jgi:rod shape-determining protein MreC
MPVRYPPGSRYRSLAGTWGPLLVAIGLALLPPGAKDTLAVILEHSVFAPFRLAVGWGPRSLAQEQRLSRTLRDLSKQRWDAEDALETHAENGRLRRLLGFRRRAEFELNPAVVVGHQRGRYGDLLIVSPADPAAAAPGTAVLAPDGLVGRVRAPEGRFVRVECLTHVNMAVSVLNQRSLEGGIVRWNGEGRGLVIEGLPGQADWQIGDRLVTSGFGTAFPRGVLVGWVVRQEMQGGGLLKSVSVRPAASAARTEEVFFLRSPEGAGSVSLSPWSVPSSAGASPAGAPGAGPPGEDEQVAEVAALYPVDAGLRLRKLPGSSGVGPDPRPAPVP